MTLSRKSFYIGILLAVFLSIGYSWFCRWGFSILFKEFLQRGDFFRKNNLIISYDQLYFNIKGEVVFKTLSIKKIEGRTLWDLEASQLKVCPDWSLMIQGKWRFKNIDTQNVQLLFIDKKNKQKKLFIQRISGSLRAFKEDHGRIQWKGGFMANQLILRKLFYAKKMRVLIEKGKVNILPFKLYWGKRSINGKAIIKTKEKLIYLADKKLNLYLKSNSLGTEVLLKAKEKSDRGLLKTIEKGKVYIESFLDPEYYEDYLSGRVEEISSKISFSRPLSARGICLGKNGEFIIKTEGMKILDFNIDQIRLNLGMDQNTVFIKEVYMRMGGGSILCFGVIQKNKIFSSGVLIDLKKIKIKDLGRCFLKNDESIEGQLNGNIVLMRKSGSDHRWILGGHLKLLRANLWNVNLMKGILKVFQKIFPNLGKVRFNHSAVEFLIESGKLYIKKLRMVSAWVVLEITGQVDLKTHGLNLDVLFSLKPMGLRDETVLSKVISSALMIAGKQVWKAQVRGTWENPLIVPKFFSILEPFENIFVHPLKKAVQN